MLRRLSDQAVAHQSVQVAVDGVDVGVWRQPLGNANQRWLHDTFVIPAEYTDNRDVITVTLTPLDGAPAWHAARYDVFARVSPFDDEHEPGDVSALTAAAAGSSAISLSWDPAFDNVGVARYEVYASAKSGFTAGPDTLIGEIGVHGFRHTGLDPNQTWHYRVRAVDGAGNTGPLSNEVKGTTAPPIVASDDFDGTSLDTQRWSRIVRDAGNYRVEDGALVLPTALGSIHGPGRNNATDLILQPAPEAPWTATTKLAFDPRVQFQQAGLLFYGSDDNYARLDLEAAAGGSKQLLLTRETAGQADSQSQPVPVDFPETFWLRLVFDGSGLAASYSTDGTTFAPLGSRIDVSDLSDPAIGLYAWNGNPDAPLAHAAFATFTLTNDLPALGKAAIFNRAPITAANAAAYRVDGSAAPGATVDVTLTDADGAQSTAGATASDAGFYEATVDATGLADGAVTIRAVDSAGATADATVHKDTTDVSPSAPTISDPAPLTLHTVATYTVTGKAEAGATVEVALRDDAGGVVTASRRASPDGSYSVPFNLAALMALADGSITITAKAIDVVGANGPPVEATTVKDTSR